MYDKGKVDNDVSSAIKQQMDLFHKHKHVHNITTTAATTTTHKEKLAEGEHLIIKLLLASQA